MPGARVENLFQHLPDASVEEVTQILVSSPNARLERIVSHGQASPDGFWYDQAEPEWVMVLAGRARLTIEADSRELELAPGDSLFLPAHCRHRVSWTDPDQETIWLALFLDAGTADISHASLS